MSRSRPIYQDFLTELKALDDFLLTRPNSRRYVERTDPDIRRLMESMAFFSARSRKLAVDGFGRAVVRLATGHMEEVLRPQPSRALIQATPNAHMVEPVSLPTGTEMRVQAESIPFAGADQKAPTIALFRTMAPVTIWPLRIQQARLSLRATRGFRILIELRADQPIRIEGAPLSFHISNLGDYHASRKFLYAIQRHLERAAIVYSDEEPTPQTDGVECEVSYGRLHRDDKDRVAHPLARLGTFFHFPEIELYLHLRPPERERPWRRAWVCLDLSDEWPADAVVNKDIFQLFVVPISNARREPAEPIVCDGTKDGYALYPPGPFPDDSLLVVEGVYKEAENGWQPLLPAHLASVAPEGTGTYEVEAEMAEDGIETGSAVPGGEEEAPEIEGARLLLNIPDAFENPCKVLVDAYWHQPWFDGNTVERLQMSLQNRYLKGVTWALRGRVRDTRPSQVMSKPFEILHLLALVGQTVLDLPEIKHVGRYIGADDTSVFGEAVDLLTELRVQEQRARTGEGIEYLYRFTVGDVSDDMEALVFDLLAKLEILLDAWSWSPVSVAEDASKNPARKPAK